MYKTVLGFDFGLKRIGVAVGQSVTLTATPLAVLKANRGIPNWEEVAKLIAAWQPQALIVGLPLCLDGERQQLTEFAGIFAEALHERFILPVYQVDERLTTRSAREQVFTEGGYKALQKSSIDSIAAKLIVEDWFRQHHD